MRRLLLLAALALPTVTLAHPGDLSARHAGGLISVDWKDASLTDALRLIAKVGQLNLVLDPAAQGKTMTLALQDVPWQQALDLIVATHGFGAEVDGNVLKVAPLSKMTQESQQRAQLREAREASAPLSTIAFPLSWTNASQAEALVKESLSPRGTTRVDRRTNTLFVTDDFSSGTASIESLFSPALELSSSQGSAFAGADVIVRLVGLLDEPVSGVRAVMPPAREAAPSSSARMGLEVGRRVDVPGAPGVKLGLERDGSRLVLVVKAGRTGAQVPADGRQAVALSLPSGREALLIAATVVN